MSRSANTALLLTLSGLGACEAGGPVPLDTAYDTGVSEEWSDRTARALSTGDDSSAFYSDESSCEGSGSSSYKVALGPDGAIARGRVFVLASGRAEECKVSIWATLTNDLPSGTRARASGLQADLTSSGGEDVEDWISAWTYISSADFARSARTVDEDPPWSNHFTATINARHTLVTDSKYTVDQELTERIEITWCWGYTDDGECIERW